jgi:outer membrane protein W
VFTIVRRALVALAFAALASSAAAQTPFGPRSYFTVRGGAYLPQADGLTDFGPGADFEAVVGRQLYPFLAVEMGAGYFGSSASVVEIDWGNSFASVDTDQQISVVPVVASFRASLPTGDLEPYLVAGAGLYFVTMEKERLDTRLVAADEDAVFGLHVGAGATFPIAGSAFVFADARYLFARARVFEGNDWTRSETSLDLRGLRAAAGIGMRF